jgi:HSP20 family protein
MFKKESSLSRPGTFSDPFSLLRQMTTEFDRMFGLPTWPTFRTAATRVRQGTDVANWFPEIDVFEKDNRLITRIDLPGMKKDDVKVEVTDGQLTISGERKSELEDKRENFYRCEREYGSFYRVVPLPDGVPVDDVRAMFSDGVLEISVPLPVQQPQPRSRRVEVQEAKPELTAV